MQKGNSVGAHARSLCKRIFHLLLNRLGIRRLKEHSFFGSLLARPAGVADFGAHRGEFFAALKAEYPVSRALLVEADSGLAESLKRTSGSDAHVLHGALVGENRGATVVFTRSKEPESSSIFNEWAASNGVADQPDVPALDFAKAIRELGGRVDLAKFDVEGSEVEVLEAVSASDLANCGQVTVEFHDKRLPLTRADVARVCRRMRREGYGVLHANWPYVDDVLFVNLKGMLASRRLESRCRIALANALFVAHGVFFSSVRFLKKT